MPKLSLIVPAKDCAHYLPQVYRSILMQAEPHPLQPDPIDLKELQVIAVDDGSSDGTAQVLDEFGAKFDNFEVITNPTNVGLANGRNQGLDRAEGEYIVFLDGDDWLAPNHLPTMLAAMESLHVDFVRCDHTTVTGNKRGLKRAPMSVRNRALNPRTGILPAHTNTMVDYPYAWAGIFHRRLRDSGLLYFPKDFMTAEDRSWIWGLHLDAESFAVIDAPGIMYRRNVSGSLTQILDERQLMFLDAFDLIFERLDNDSEGHTFYPKAARNLFALMEHHHKRYIQAVAYAQAVAELGVDTAETSADSSVLDHLKLRVAGRRGRSQMFLAAVEEERRNIQATKDPSDLPPVQIIPQEVLDALRARGGRVAQRIPRDVFSEVFAASTDKRQAHISWYLPETERTSA
ncbi:hypothetical protein HMPREF2757_07030 [Brevibacterium sp. HMSC063G07]|nr:hypothetical protein HMPREF2757_07030 [Brevibacterium sp. HMSC063G07]